MAGGQTDEVSTTRPRPLGPDAWEEPTMKVALVARRLGVAPATLRTWARRYGLGPSAHTAGAHRQYSGEDMGRLLVMRRLTIEGVAPAEAARIALSRPTETSPGEESVGEVRALVRTRPDEPGSRRGETAAGGAEPDGEIAADLSSRCRELAGSARDMDADRCSELLDSCLETHGVVLTWSAVVRPALDDVKDRWDRAETRVDATPMLSDCVINAVSRVVSVVGGPPKVLLACAEDEEHSVALHVLSAALWERATPTRSLGARVPRETLAAVARQVGPHATVVVAVLPVRDHDQLYGLPGVHPAMTVVATGPGWVPEQLPPSVAYMPGLAGLVSVLAAAG